MKKIIFVIVLFMAMTTQIGAQGNHLPDIKVDISTMLPTRYEPRMGLTGFSFDLKNDSAFVHLPYIGEVYTPVYGDSGLNFDEPCTNIKVEKTKKEDGRILSFEVKHDIVHYKFQMTIYDNNSVDLFMQPSNAQSCSYSGDWE